MTAENEGKRMRCPKCRSDQLAIIEVTDNVGTTDFGTVRLDDYGDMILPSKFWMNPGLITYQGLLCSDCRHQWKPRGPKGVSTEPASSGEARS